jgi:hypothetical protein
VGIWSAIAFLIVYEKPSFIEQLTFISREVPQQQVGKAGLLDEPCFKFGHTCFARSLKPYLISIETKLNPLPQLHQPGDPPIYPPEFEEILFFGSGVNIRTGSPLFVSLRYRFLS